MTVDTRVLVGIASIPERVHALEQTLRSIAPQADRVAVALNEYGNIPRFIADHPNVDAFLLGGLGGDAEKFAAVDSWEGIVATCDDDLVYPPDYIARLRAGLDRYGFGTIVGFHGGTTAGYREGSHSAATLKRIRCLGHLEADDPDVNVLGTGALAYHAGTVPIWRGLFRTANMADVHLACHAHELGIPMVALAHAAGWLEDICPPDSRQIYLSNSRGDGSPLDTRAARKAELDRIDWLVEPVRPLVRVSVATCSRPHLLAELLDDLEREARWVDLQVAVFEDPTDADYAELRDRVIRRGWSWNTFSERLGKDAHWRLVDAELEGCRSSGAEWFVFLPDDVRLVRHAIPRAIRTWSRLIDPSALTLWRLKDHEGQTNWTGRRPVELEHASEIFHVDGIYLCRRETLEFLGYRCPAIAARPRLSSSGVGRAMSLRLHEAGRRMYRVHASLAVPVPGEPSVMNPNARDRRFPGVAL